MTTIGPISSSVGTAHAQVLKRAEQALQTEKPTQAFTDRITNAIDQVADAQTKTAELAKAYEMGQENDLSKVMISQQVSSLGFQLTLNVRNKVLSAYKDIMNMPV
jgi:flagellar hook-basal body complex protein FliE